MLTEIRWFFPVRTPLVTVRYRLVYVLMHI